MVNLLRERIKKIIVRTKWGKARQRRRWLDRLPTSGEFAEKAPTRRIAEILDKYGQAFEPDGKMTWYLSSYVHRRNREYGPARVVLEFIETHVPKGARIFETGCGPGWLLFDLARRGYTDLHGSDIVAANIAAGIEIAPLLGAPVELWVDNGFRPTRIPERCDVILAIHWLYSAWHGNYSEANEGLKERNHRELLEEFVAPYAPHVAPGGYFVVELADALSNLKVRETGTYPVRHSEEEVRRCFGAHGFTVVKRWLECSHQILSTYVLRKAPRSG
jgi:SAM-dependent methyltransferase